MMKTKYCFDVDGTLTPSRQKMDKNFAVWFSKFCERNDVYLVTGSDKPRTIEQVGECIYNRCTRVYQCSGGQTYKGDLCIESSDWILPMSARNWLENQLEESTFNMRTGNHIEQRPCMVNFSIVGRGATQIQRQAYVKHDTETGERSVIRDLFNERFPQLQATAGGETGLDIGPVGSDKSQILKDFSLKDNIIFYGDAVQHGGNDFPLANALEDYPNSHSVHVKGWEDTWDILKEIK